MNSPNYTDNSYCLTKALFHASSCLQFLEVIKIDTKGEVKNLFNLLINKIEFVVNNITHRLNDEDRKILKEELDDSISVQAILDDLVRLNPKQRETIENLTNALVKGETIEFIDKY